MNSRIFAMVLAVSTAMGADRPNIVGHGDAEVDVVVHLKIVDPAHQPLEDVCVRFYTRMQFAMIQARRLELRAKGASEIPDPVPIEVLSDKSGRVDLRCHFSAAFLQGLVGGEPKTVETDIFPSGMFQFFDRRLGWFEYESSSLYSKPSYQEPDFNRIATVVLTNQPNQSLEPTGLAGTPSAGAEAAPAKPVAHH